MQVNVPVPLSVWEMHFWDAFFSTALQILQICSQTQQEVVFSDWGSFKGSLQSRKKDLTEIHGFWRRERRAKRCLLYPKNQLLQWPNILDFLEKAVIFVAFLGVVSKNVWLVTRALLKSSRICFPTWRIIPVSRSLIRGGCTYILETPPNIWMFNTSRRLGFPPFHGGDLVGGIGPKCPKHSGLGNKNWVCWVLIDFLPRIEDLSVRPKPNKPAVRQKNRIFTRKAKLEKKDKKVQTSGVVSFFRSEMQSHSLTKNILERSKRFRHFGSLKWLVD